MNSKSLSELLEEAFVQCRDMDASLAQRLQAFADAVRRFGPQFQTAVDKLVDRLRQHDVGENAPQAWARRCQSSCCPTKQASSSVSTRCWRRGPLR